MNQYLKLSEELAYLKSYQTLAYWDYETIMPSGAAEWRSKMLGFMAGQIHSRFTSDEFFKSTVEAYENETRALNKIAIGRTLAEIEKYKKIPQNLVEEISQASTLSHAAWVEAKNNNNFSLFAPHLEKMITLIQKQALLIGEGKFENIYDALLDEYSPGMSIKTIEQLFSKLKPELQKLIQNRKDTVDKKWIVPISIQQKICNDVIDWFGFNRNHLIMATSSHPFCLFLHPDDVRLTTRYDESDPLGSIFSVIHELGHGLYDHQLDKSHPGTAKGEDNGMDIHESQSRFWEVCIGSSFEFYKWMWNWFDKNHPECLAGWTIEELYAYGTQVRPSLIRTESDPVTYGMHIMIRFEIERLILDNKINVNEIPAKWNSLYEQYLGITPPNDTLGVLQDVHWSGGSFGYFPSYLLGTMIACQLFQSYEKQNPEIMKMILEGNLKPVHLWLKENIHQFGKGKSIQQMLIDTTGSELRIEPFLNLLKDRYCKVNELKKISKIHLQEQSL